MAHSSCGNSSNISGNLNVRNITNSGARLLMTHALSGFSGGRVSNYIGDDGVTAGDAIRYDVISGSASENLYTKAQADIAENAEIIGVIESINEGVVNVVLSGQMVYPSSKLISATHIDETLGTSGATGGNDIYFLSEVTAGAIQNLAPNEPTRIAKPILQQAADGTYTHHVVNYIGYQIGGSVVATDGDEPPTNLNMKTYLGDGSPFNEGSNTFDLGKRSFVPVHVDDPDYQRRKKTFSNAVERTYLKERPWGRRFCFISDIGWQESLWLNKAGWFIDEKGARVFRFKVTHVGDTERPNIKCIYVTTTEPFTSLPPISYKAHSSAGGTATITDAYETGVALPQMKTRSKNIQAQDINGNTVNLVQQNILELKSNEGDLTVHVPDVLSANEIKVTKKMVVENSSLSVDDLASVIDTLVSDINTLRKEVNGLSASASAASAKISSK